MEGYLARAMAWVIEQLADLDVDKIAIRPAMQDFSFIFTSGF